MNPNSGELRPIESTPKAETSTPNFVKLDRWVVYLQNNRHGDQDWRRNYCCLAENERHAREQATSNDSECWEIIRCELAPPQNFDEFLEVYGFVENAGRFACGGSIDDKSYGWETFSPDIDEVVKIANSEPGRVHTVVDGDDGRLWLTSGYHLVNRVFYIITQKPYLGPDFDIPCEEPRDFDRLDKEAFKAVDVDEDIYWAENGGYYDKQAFLDLAKGDEELAYRIYSLCEWQCPQTLIDEDASTSINDCVFPELRGAEILDDQPTGVEPLFSLHLGGKGLDDKPRERLKDMQSLVTFSEIELNINLQEILELHGMHNFDEVDFYMECAKELLSFGYFVFNDDWFEIYSKELIIEYVNNQ